MKLFVFILSIAYFAEYTFGQSFLFFQQSDNQSIELSFEEKGNLMLLDLKLNKIPIEMILDTGAENNLLFEKELGDLMGLKSTRTIKILGADQQRLLNAYLIANVELALNNKISAPSSFIALEDMDVSISSIMGANVHGLIGSNLFSNSVLFVDNRKDKVSLIPYENFTIPKNYYYFPIEIHRNRPYLSVKIKIHGQEPKIMKLLLDTGSSVSTLLYANKNTLELPDNAISGQLGIGLGGALEGYLGIVEEIEFGKEKLKDIPCSFQVLSDSVLSSNIFEKQGILGNSILSHYNYYIDYYNEIIFIKRIKKPKKIRRYDKSGLTIVATGADFSHFLVSDVRDNSPAEEAGILEHDQIYKINGRRSSTMTLEDVQDYFRRKDGRSTKLTIRRNGHLEKIRFQLVDPFR